MRSKRHTLTATLAAVAILVGSTFVFAGVASAHHNTVTGVPSCLDSKNEFTVTWTVVNSENRKEDVEWDTNNGSPDDGEFSLGKNGSKTFVTTGHKSNVTIVVKGEWDNGQKKTDTFQVKKPGKCPPPTTTTTTVPETTTTTESTTTTTSTVPETTTTTESTTTTSTVPETTTSTVPETTTTSTIPETTTTVPETTTTVPETTTTVEEGCAIGDDDCDQVPTTVTPETSSTSVVAPPADGAPYTCEELGYVDITTADPLYHADLDADRDGVACESGEELAFTGTSNWLLAGTGFAMLLVGGFMLILGRRRTA